MSDRWFEYRTQYRAVWDRRIYWPVSWQGWAVIGAFVVNILVAWLASRFLPSGAFIVFAIVGLALLVTIPLKAKKEGTHWPGAMRDR